MLFSSVGFLFRFLPVFMLIYLISPARYRNVILVAGSLIFYGVGEPFFVLLLIFSILVNYGLSEYMWWEPKKPQKNRKKKAARRQKTALIAALIFDLSFLFVFKYHITLSVQYAAFVPVIRRLAVRRRKMGCF